MRAWILLFVSVAACGGPTVGSPGSGTAPAPGGTGGVGSATELGQWALPADHEDDRRARNGLSWTYRQGRLAHVNRAPLGPERPNPTAAIDRARLLEGTRRLLEGQGWLRLDPDLRFLQQPLYCYSWGDGRELATGVAVMRDGAVVATVWVGIDGRPRRVYLAGP